MADGRKHPDARTAEANYPPQGAADAMRKRKVTYPVARTATKQPRVAGLPGDPTYVRSTVATINLQALDVREDLKVGHRVKIGGEGLYSGEFAVVESLSSGIIPAAVVRTEAGKTRRVRSVDLERVAAQAPTPVAAPVAAPSPIVAPVAIVAPTPVAAQAPAPVAAQAPAAAPVVAPATAPITAPTPAAVTAPTPAAVTAPTPAAVVAAKPTPKPTTAPKRAPAASRAQIAPAPSPKN